VGAKARDLLAVNGYSGKVLAAFSTTIYLQGWGDEILWVAGEGLPLHRRCLLASFPPRSVCAGQNFFVQGGHLRIGEGIAFKLDRAMEWEPLTVRPGQAEPLARVGAGVRRLLAAIPAPGSDEGLGQAIRLISALADRRDPTIFRPNSLAARALNLVLGLARACFGQEINQVARIGRELVGLGPGLTPSGDDFLGGLLFTTRSLKMAYPGDFHWEEQPITDLINWARARTNSISYAIFSDLALGHGPEPLHDLIRSLLQGEDPGKVIAGITRLLRIGHISGWDILAGVLTGMLLVEGKVNNSSIAHRA
jgi:hypothetical protein